MNNCRSACSALVVVLQSSGVSSRIIVWLTGVVYTPPYIVCDIIIALIVRRNFFLVLNQLNQIQIILDG